MTGRARFIVFLLVLLCRVPAFAQEKGTAPPPPLFPRHRRGIYRNAQGIELVDATPQSPPLQTDDPGVPDPGEYEVNLTTDADLSGDVKRFDLLFVDANYGLLPKIAGHELPMQVKFEFPVTATREIGNPFTVGVGTAAFGLKLNFYRNENTGLSVSFYPQVEFAPESRAVEKGLADPGQTIVLPVLVAKDLKHFILVANAGVEAPVHDSEGEGTGILGFGVGRAITRTLAAMLEVRGESTFDLNRDRLVFLNVGLIRGIRNVVVYAQVGRSLFSDDGTPHTYLGAGMKLLIHGKKI